MGLFSPAPYHILSYGTLLGTTFFHTFVGGTASFRVLDRPQFAALMAKIFPIYFAMQTALPVVMALTYPASKNPFGSAGGVAGVLDHSNRAGVLIPLAGAFLCALANLTVVGPATTRCMAERKQQETEYGKRSQEVLALNKKFGMLHGISSLLNMGTFIASLAYGFTLSSRLS
ncbi:Putative mitochondrial outer membrane protein [Madurella fahalii]|uniref:Mitochondrial outer membrane protein n=1 Tax=Madurella fahalii TaxID=1157608 RepID=A0ABQ0GSA9_9PEZI